MRGVHEARVLFAGLVVLALGLTSCTSAPNGDVSTMGPRLAPADDLVRPGALSFRLAGLIGMAVERYGLRNVHKNGHVAELLFTFGLAFAIEEVVQIIWGKSPVDFRVPEQQIGRRREMGFMGPFFPWQGAPEKALADVHDVGGGQKQARSKVGQ